jgi:hypothetical protein
MWNRRGDGCGGSDALRRGVRLVFLSAADDEVARLYGRAGFRLGDHGRRQRRTGVVEVGHPLAARRVPPGPFHVEDHADEAS